MVSLTVSYVANRVLVLCRLYSLYLSALIGGVVGQEVLTACSGKFMPIKQWFYFDASETLSDTPLPQEEVSPVGSRYDGQIMVYGKQLQSQLSQLNMFLVGAGAIGCEMIKNWAMMGISCPAKGGKGITYVTDMDRIEKSNLSRQFLFRNTDINHPKSTTAARAGRYYCIPCPLNEHNHYYYHLLFQ